MENRVLTRALSIIIALVMVASVVALPMSQDQGVYGATKKYTIKYNVNGGKFTASKYAKKSVVTKKVKKGKKLGAAPKAKKEGYVLLGWYTKKSGGTEATKTTKATKKMTLYAKWAKPLNFEDKFKSMLSKKYATLDDFVAEYSELKPKKDYEYTDKYGTFVTYVISSGQEISLSLRKGHSEYVIDTVYGKVGDFFKISGTVSYKTIIKRLGAKLIDYDKKYKFVSGYKGDYDFGFTVDKKGKTTSKKYAYLAYYYE